MSQDDIHLHTKLFIMRSFKRCQDVEEYKTIHIVTMRSPQTCVPSFPTISGARKVKRSKISEKSKRYTLYVDTFHILVVELLN